MLIRSLAAVFDAEGWEPPSPPALDVCGAGTDACCVFLVVSDIGPECARFTKLHPTCVTSDMNARFIPATSDCQGERVILENRES